MRMFAKLFILLFPLSAYAVDGVSVEAGNGNATDMFRVGLQQDWNQKWFTQGSWSLGGYWDATLGSWHGKSGAGGNRNVTDIGLTPVFRFQQHDSSSFSPYVEGAIGFHLISPTLINADRKFGSSFQFGDHVGLGAVFGKNCDLGYRFQHLSNGSIRKPNQGINFNQVRFAYHF